MAFIKTHFITAKYNGRCNAYHCQHKSIERGERVVHTVATYRQKLISAVWHPQCHKEATAFAPDWAQLLAIKANKAPMPAEYYNHTTGLPLRLQKNK